MWISATPRRQSTAPRTRAPLAHAVLSAAIASLACGALPAQGETGPSSGVCSTAPPTAHAHSGAAGLPSKLTVGVGARQATPRATRFPIRLAVTVTDAERDPLPGVLITFVAPIRGPSGRFTVRSGGARLPRSHSPDTPTLHLRRVEVRSDTCGIALAPVFTANDRAGGYVVVASAERARAAFALVNETA
jgi:hypothetical protein